ncbi:DUF2330 domain-containing protein [Chondromyces crocatus]|uniref:DUF2330 domain-containing protein n=1 Tax=Chondromyces crocatus TaxID=52 RepID=A0A0K1E959_CHOCO|nr:DUF2330 domain-containing protein [Chondromyces crocatus]AKT37410.1 uncharacterized protein CMC5_015510 [Chondromyces crocatus]
MRHGSPLIALSLLICAATHVESAWACGACIVAQSESTLVTGHRMVLSVSQNATTLWDQFSYTGDPVSFAWVLPIKGVVEVGLSSDALFQTLEALTQVTVSSPIINCPPPPRCGDDAPLAGGGTGADGSTDSVQILAQETVGPYETVQLSSNDPAALYSWLQQNNYFIPQDLAPVITSYVNEGFGFLALKLVPGEAVDAMRPVRVTSPGATATLPLRMVAGGTGAVTPISLWVLGEGRYEPANFPSFQIEPSSLVWDWAASRSNYGELRQVGYSATNGRGWLLEAGEPVSSYAIEYPLTDLVNYSPQESGYFGAPEKDITAYREMLDDLDKLYGQLPPGSLWVSRMTGELTRAALDDDLDLTASSDQSPIPRFLKAQNAIGLPPACPSTPSCDPWQSGDVSGGGGIDPPGGDDIWGRPGSCSMGSGAGSPASFGSLAAAAALALSRRRRRHD